MANTWAIKLGRPAWSVLRRYILGNRPLWFFVAFGALTTYMLWPFYPGEAELRNEWVGNVAVEGFGFLMDIILFGLLWSVYDVYRERRTKIRGYQDELRDYIPWEGQEGVLRKAGIIKRLNELQVSLPLLYGIYLEGARLVEANLKGAGLWKANLAGSYLMHGNLEACNLSRANLKCAYLMSANLARADLSGTNLAHAVLLIANLEGAYLEGAYLEGADLYGTNLEGAEDLTWDQLEQAKTNDETILPAYLKENAPEWYKGRFAGEKGEQKE